MIKLGLKPNYIALVLVIIILLAGIIIVKEKVLDASNDKIDISEIDTYNNWIEVNKDIFVSSDNGKTNMTLVVSGKEAAIIDTGYKHAQALKVNRYIEENDLSLKYIFLTHKHIDHITNIDICKTDKTRLINRQNVKNGQIITMGDKDFKVIYTDGHTDDHISIELVNENVLVAGDIIVNNGLPAIGWDINSFIKTLNAINDREYSLVIPGHGYILETDVALGRHLEYLENAEKKVKDLINSEGTLRDVSSIRVEDCFSDNDHIDKDFFIGNHESILQLIFVEAKKELN